jgi:hypothetical protein
MCYIYWFPTATIVTRTRLNITFMHARPVLFVYNSDCRNLYLKMQVHLSQQILFESSKCKTTFWPFSVPAVGTESFGYSFVLRRVCAGISVTHSASIYCE